MAYSCLFHHAFCLHENQANTTAPSVTFVHYKGLKLYLLSPATCERVAAVLCL